MFMGVPMACPGNQVLCWASIRSRRPKWVRYRRDFPPVPPCWLSHRARRCRRSQRVLRVLPDSPGPTGSSRRPGGPNGSDNAAAVRWLSATFSPSEQYRLDTASLDMPNKANPACARRTIAIRPAADAADLADVLRRGRRPIVAGGRGPRASGSAIRPSSRDPHRQHAAGVAAAIADDRGPSGRAHHVAAGRRRSRRRDSRLGALAAAGCACLERDGACWGTDRIRERVRRRAIP